MYKFTRKCIHAYLLARIFNTHIIMCGCVHARDARVRVCSRLYCVWFARVRVTHAVGKKPFNRVEIYMHQDCVFAASHDHNRLGIQSYIIVADLSHKILVIFHFRTTQVFHVHTKLVNYRRAKTSENNYHIGIVLALCSNIILFDCRTYKSI